MSDSKKKAGGKAEAPKKTEGGGEGRVQASAISFARVCGPCTSGRPGRGESTNPARPSRSKRERHFHTVRSEQPTSPAIRAAERPSTAPSTIRARSTARRSAVRERTSRSNSRRSSAPIPIRFALAATSIASIVAHQDDDSFDREQPDPASQNELTGATTSYSPRHLRRNRVRRRRRARGPRRS